MAPDLVRTSSKRRRATQELDVAVDRGASRDKQVKTALGSHVQRVDRDATNALHDTRRTLMRLFGAMEATLLSSRSLNTFHSIQQAVKSTARSDFELPHLAQLLGVWRDAYHVEPCMALIQHARVPSLSITFSADDSRPHLPAQRRSEFSERLEAWTGQSATLPSLTTFTQLPLNSSKVASMSRPAIEPSIASSLGVIEATPAARAHALKERLKLKALQKASSPSSADLKEATIKALVPAAVKSIKLLLASRTKKAIGMLELSDNLCTSLHARMGREDMERVVEAISQMPQYAGWCKVGLVGSVKIVRFIGPAPQVQ